MSETFGVDNIAERGRNRKEAAILELFDLKNRYIADDPEALKDIHKTAKEYGVSIFDEDKIEKNPYDILEETEAVIRDQLEQITD